MEKNKIDKIRPKGLGMEMHKRSYIIDPRKRMANSIYYPSTAILQCLVSSQIAHLVFARLYKSQEKSPKWGCLNGRNKLAWLTSSVADVPTSKFGLFLLMNELRIVQ